MSLQDRAQRQFSGSGHYIQGGSAQSAQLDPQKSPSPISLSPRDLFAIVDGELVNVLGTTDIPGMSPAYWCSDNNTGASAAVSAREAAVFTTAQQALQFLEQQRRQPGQSIR